MAVSYFRPFLLSNVSKFAISSATTSYKCGQMAFISICLVVEAVVVISMIVFRFYDCCGSQIIVVLCVVIRYGRTISYDTDLIQ